jgi:sugar/nucleoside kinase (ribokinase family)
MPYDDLLGRLDTATDTVTVGAFPDGSVDEHYRLLASSSLASREGFAEAVAAGRDTFETERVAVTPGGQAVNVARQASALGDEVLLAGHLDHPLFDFGFETASMGAPATVRVNRLEADDLLFVEPSADIGSWTFADLRAALGEDVEAFLERDALCCANWASAPGLADAFAEIATLGLDGGVCCVDPGPLDRLDDLDVVPFLDGLSRLSGSHDVVLSVNADEAARLAAVVGHEGGIGVDGAGVGALHAVRERVGGRSVVVHATETAVAATPDGRASVPTLDVRRGRTETGAGDRFDAGLAHALAADWGWDLALALGNACASHYVETGDTADPVDLRSHVATRRP